MWDGLLRVESPQERSLPLVHEQHNAHVALAYCPL